MRSSIQMIVALLFFHIVHAQTSYQVVSVPEGGSIVGTVVLSKASAAEVLEITKDDAICGRSKPSPSLVLGKGNGVKDAVVILEGISKGKQWGTTSAVLDQQGCEYVPHVMVVPVGTQLEIVNSDPILHNVHAYNTAPVVKTLFNIAQPIKGQRTSIRQTRINSPGVVFALCDAGHPWMTAYVVAVEHPYYAVTDSDGRFVIEHIPEGSYTLKMWHEGVKVVRRDLERGKVKKYHFEAPYEIRKPVKVRRGREERIDFALTLR